MKTIFCAITSLVLAVLPLCGQISPESVRSPEDHQAWWEEMKKSIKESEVDARKSTKSKLTEFLQIQNLPEIQTVFDIDAVFNATVLSFVVLNRSNLIASEPQMEDFQGFVALFIKDMVKEDDHAIYLMDLFKDIYTANAALDPVDANRSGKGSAISEGDQFAELTTTDGTVYKEVTIRKILPEGLSIVHSAGAKTLFAHHLPQEFTEGLKFLSAEQIAAKKASDGQALATKPTPKNSALAPHTAPRYITTQEMKVYWLSRIPAPSSLSPNYSEDMKARQQFIADVRAGKYEARAAQAAASFNREQAIKAQDAERARLYGEDLARADAALAAEETSLAAQEANNDLRGRLELIRIKLGQIHGQMVIDASSR